MFALVCGEVSMCKIVHDPVSLGGQPVLLKGERIQSPHLIMAPSTPRPRSLL